MYCSKQISSLTTGWRCDCVVERCCACSSSNGEKNLRNSQCAYSDLPCNDLATYYNRPSGPACPCQLWQEA